LKTIENEIFDLIKTNDAQCNLKVISRLNEQFNFDTALILKWFIRKRVELFDTIKELEFLEFGNLKIHFDIFEFIAYKEGVPYYYNRIYGIEYKIYCKDVLIDKFHGSYLKESKKEQGGYSVLEMYKLSILDGLECLVSKIISQIFITNDE